MKILENILGGLLIYALAIIAFMGISTVILLGVTLFLLHYEVALTIGIISIYAYIKYEDWRKRLDEKRKWD